MGFVFIIWALILSLKIFTTVVTVGWFVVVLWPLFIPMAFLVFLFVVVAGNS